jgi:hypothetical protein
MSNAMFLRVGIDKGCGGALAPILGDGSFEYIPIPEDDPDSTESRTYKNTIGRSGRPFAYYLPKRISNIPLHYDPEFETFTYGDLKGKRKYLLKLDKDDLLVFYAGLTPFKNSIFDEALYIIGYFTINRIIDFNRLNKSETEVTSFLYNNNAHIKRSYNYHDLVIVVGDKTKSLLLDKAVLISSRKIDKRGRSYHAVSPEMEKQLGITGSIQRSIPPRLIKNEDNLINLRRILQI